MAIATRGAAAPVKPGLKPVGKKPAIPGSALEQPNVSEATLTVKTTLLENGMAKGEPVVAEDREVKIFATKPGVAALGVKYKKNLGNYEGIEWSVFCSMPCYNEEWDNAFAQVQDKVKTKLEEVMAEISIEPSEATDDTTGVGEVTEETTETPTEEAGDITQEAILEADHDTLVEICTTNPQLEVNPDDYTDDDDLKQVLISVIFGETDEKTQEPSSDEYTEKELTAGTTDELKAVFEAWQLGAYPKGPEKIAKKSAIKKILAAQEARKG